MVNNVFFAPWGKPLEGGRGSWLGRIKSLRMEGLVIGQGGFCAIVEQFIVIIVQLVAQQFIERKFK